VSPARPTITWEELLYPGRAVDFFRRDPLPPFDLESQGFNVGNAWWMAELSRLVYRCDMPGLPPATSVDELLRLGRWQRTAIFTSELLGAQALLVRSLQPTACAVLAFRGTQQKLQDLLHDADAWLVAAAPGARVHRGFQRALDAVWPAIAAALPMDCPLFFTGHSLGAALALLAATRHAPRAVYTFGAPRVGDEGFVHLLQHVPVHRVVHGDDIVSAVPPSTLGFRHAGTEVRVGVATLSNAKLDPRSLWTGFGMPAKPLADHAPINYTRCLL
jgi:triacylglycerol lipase